MTAATTTNITLPCGGCMEDVSLNLSTGTVTMTIPSNGRRGSLHVAAHTVTADVYTVLGDLPAWDCPACGYADSWDESA